MRAVAEPRIISKNHILNALSAEEYGRLAPHLETVSLRLGQVLCRPDEQLRHVYLPVTVIVSLLTDLEDGYGMEVGLVGREGVVGISVILGGDETKVATVQAPGQALVLDAEKFREEFRRSPLLQDITLRYTHALMTQISQSVVCNVRHTIEDRLARWLLMYRDRLDGDEFPMTQEFMAAMLGVRRAGVSEAAARLQKEGLIRYFHGRMTILDRRGLESVACECYEAVKERFDLLLCNGSSADALRTGTR
jgi:CRP-like cAMP-binding protein